MRTSLKHYYTHSDAINEEHTRKNKLFCGCLALTVIMALYHNSGHYDIYLLNHNRYRDGNFTAIVPKIIEDDVIPKNSSPQQFLMSKDGKTP